MPGTKIFIVSCLAAAALPALAVQPDYFPIAVDNQWVYRSTGQAPVQTWVVDIPRYEFFGDRAYFLVRGFPGGDAWVRMDESSTLWAWDAAERRDRVWAAFATAEGDSYRTEIDPCSRAAQVVSRKARLSGPLGDFTETLRVRYATSGCADAGFTEDYYLPWIGLIERTFTTIAGPRTFQLIYARLGGITVVSEQQISFALSLDRSIYYANLMPPVDPQRAVPVMTARLTLRNTDQPIRLEYPSGQTYDLAIRNEKGDVVYQWSDGQAFTMALRMETFGPGEKNWTITVPLGLKGVPFAEGRYVAEGWLTTIGPKAYATSVGFEIRHTH
jgi:hypothetical protein